MRRTIRYEMIGHAELSLIEVLHPTDPSVRGVTYEIRMQVRPGQFTRPISNNTVGFKSLEEAWEAGVKHANQMNASSGNA